MGLTLALTVALVGCGDDNTSTTTSTANGDSGGGAGPVEDQLEAARQRWDDAGISDYTMVYQPVCFCPEQHFTVTVEDDVVVSSSIDGAGMGIPTLTVDDLFDEIQSAIDDGAAHIDVTYDDDLGYPVSHWVDESENIADEEHGVTVESLTPA